MSGRHNFSDVSLCRLVETPRHQIVTVGSEGMQG